jgi:hypothetical protein
VQSKKIENFSLEEKSLKIFRLKKKFENFSLEEKKLKNFSSRKKKNFVNFSANQFCGAGKFCALWGGGSGPPGAPPPTTFGFQTFPFIPARGGVHGFKKGLPARGKKEGICSNVHAPPGYLLSRERETSKESTQVRRTTSNIPSK